MISRLGYPEAPGGGCCPWMANAKSSSEGCDPEGQRISVRISAHSWRALRRSEFNQNHLPDVTPMEQHIKQMMREESDEVISGYIGGGNAERRVTQVRTEKNVQRAIRNYFKINFTDWLKLNGA